MCARATADRVRCPFLALERSPDKNRLHARITASEALRTGFSNPEIEPHQPPGGRPRRVMRFIYIIIILCAARRSSAGEISRRDHRRRRLCRTFIHYSNDLNEDAYRADEGIIPVHTPFALFPFRAAHVRGPGF